MQHLPAVLECMTVTCEHQACYVWANNLSTFNGIWASLYPLHIVCHVEHIISVTLIGPLLWIYVHIKSLPVKGDTRAHQPLGSFVLFLMCWWRRLTASPTSTHAVVVPSCRSDGSAMWKIPCAYLLYHNGSTTQFWKEKLFLIHVEIPPWRPQFDILILTVKHSTFTTSFHEYPSAISLVIFTKIIVLKEKPVTFLQLYLRICQLQQWVLLKFVRC